MNKKELKERYQRAMGLGDVSKALETGAEMLKTYTDAEWMGIQDKVFPKHIKSSEEALRSLDRQGLIVSLLVSSQDKGKDGKPSSNAKALAKSVSNLFVSVSEWQENVAEKGWEGWKDAFDRENEEGSEDYERFYELADEIEENGWITSFINSMYSIYDFGEKYHAIEVWEKEHGIDIRIARMEDYITAKTGEERRTYEPSEKAKPRKITNKKRSKK